MFSECVLVCYTVSSFREAFVTNNSEKYFAKLLRKLPLTIC